MRIMWRGLELPGRVKRDEVSDSSYGRFVIEPFEQGFGTTIGNSLRRVLLSSLEGAAVTAVKIEGVSHEFTSIDGVVEDVTDILLNTKGIVLRYDGDELSTMTLKRNEVGEARAGDIETDPSVEVVNPDHLIATVTENVPFNMEFRVSRGRGYATAADNRRPDQELGVLPMDSIFSPVLRVRFATEAMRVGKRTNYDRLILEIWTDGSVYPEDALVEAGLILRKHLNPFVLYHELGSEMVTREKQTSAPVEPEIDTAMEERLDKPISVLNLSVRSANCLDSANVATLRELVSLTEDELLRFRSFGKTSLHEINRKLEDLDLSLGLTFAEDGTPIPSASLPEDYDPQEPGEHELPSPDASSSMIPPPATGDVSQGDVSQGEAPGDVSSLGGSGSTPVSAVGE